MSDAQPKTLEEKDDEELREVEAKIKEVTALMAEGLSRDVVDERLATARWRRDTHHGDRTSAFYISQQGHVPTSKHTQTKLQLAEVLKVRIQLGNYARELDEALERLSLRYVAVLERILSRSRY